MSAISYSQAKQLVLSDLRKTMSEMPVAERDRPRYVINFKPYSILSLIRAVERNEPDAVRWVYQRAQYLGYTVTG